MPATTLTATILCLGKIPLTIASSLVQSDRIVLPTLTMVDYARCIKGQIS